MNKSAESLWARYCAETEGAETIENETGFVTFVSFPDHIFIRECYVIPVCRQSGVGTLFMQELEALARERGLELLITSVNVTSNTCGLSLQAQLSYGFVPFSADQGKIWLRKSVPAESVVED